VEEVSGPRARTPAPIRFGELPDVAIVGARGKALGLRRVLAAVDDIERRFEVRVTALDARAVCGAAHLASAILHARSARRAGEAKAREPQVEVMRFLTGQRQIKHAIARAGVGPKTNAFAFAVEGPVDRTGAAIAALVKELALTRDDGVLRAGAAKLRRLLGTSPPAGTTDFEALALENTAMLRLE
jgi:KEOPS complex subunit Cgi121